MAILVRFHPTSMSAAQYDAVGEKLEAAGKWPPDGLLAHVSFGPSDDLRVSEIWDSREQMEAFGEVLLPMLREEGIDVENAEPEFFDVHALELREARLPEQP